MTPETTEFLKEHEDWIRHAAFDQARQIHKHSSDLNKIIADARIIADFIFATVEETAPGAKILSLVSDNKKGKS